MRQNQETEDRWQNGSTRGAPGRPQATEPATVALVAVPLLLIGMIGWLVFGSRRGTRTA